MRQTGDRTKIQLLHVITISYLANSVGPLLTQTRYLAWRKEGRRRQEAPGPRNTTDFVKVAFGDYRPVRRMTSVSARPSGSHLKLTNHGEPVGFQHSFGCITFGVERLAAEQDQ